MNHNAHFTDNNTALAIEQLILRDRDVLREAQRWTSGHRGPIVDDTETLAAADLSEFITEVVKCGAVALAATGQASDAKELERMVAEVGERGRRIGGQGGGIPARRAKDASAVMFKTVDSAKKALAEVDANCRKEMAATVNSATANITDQVNRFFGGSDPELVARLEPVLKQFSAELTMKPPPDPGTDRDRDQAVRLERPDFADRQAHGRTRCSPAPDERSADGQPRRPGQAVRGYSPH